MKRFRVILELEALADVTAEMVHKAFNTPWVTKLTIEAESPPAGVKVGFIGKGCETIQHAVIFEKEGPWSKHRVGFCGAEPTCGPVGVTDQISKGLWAHGICAECKKYIEQVNGQWVVRADAPIPGRHRPYVSPQDWDDD